MHDELERVRRFRADEPPASPAAIDSARANLMTAMQSPASPTAAMPSRPRPNRGAGSAFSRSRRRRRALAALAAACVVALVALALGTGSTSPTTAAADALQRLAKAAAHLSPVSAPHAGRYLYVDSVQANESDGYAGGASCIALVPERRQIWIRADGAGRLLETFGQASFPSPADRATCERIHALPVAGRSDSWFAPRCLELGLASRLPPGNFQDPATLLREMRRVDGGPKGPGEDFVHVGDFLRESDDSPALRAAILRAAATIRGVRLLGPTRDHLGRVGIGVGYPSHGYMSELIFDTHSSALLGEQTVSASTGRTSGWAAYRTSKVVDGVPSRPPGRLGPACVGFGGVSHTFPNGVGIVNGARLSP